MVSDEVELHVGGRVIKHPLSYRIEADIFTAADCFQLELSPGAEIACGQYCELRVNGHVELAGVVDRVSQSYDKGGRRISVEGRDLMGLLVDSCVKDWVNIDGWDIKRLAEFLLCKNPSTKRPAVPFISRRQIVYQERFIGKAKSGRKRKQADSDLAGILDKPQTISHITPGMTVFEVLRDYALSVGLLFWMEYTTGGPCFVFGRPVAGGNPSYSLVCTRSGQGNNILQGDFNQDISQRFSEVTVFGAYNSDQMKYPDAVKQDKSFPFFKPLVAVSHNGTQTPALYGRLLLEKMRQEGLQLIYRVPWHKQQGINWRINQVCQVNDELFNLNGTYLIYGRAFERSKEGTTTQLRLGPLGVIV